MTALRLLIAAIMGCLISGCTGIFFQPERAYAMRPERLGLAYSDVWLTSADGTRLHAWWLPAVGEAKATVLFLHGNAQNIGAHIASVYWMPNEGYNVLLLDYRGYGQSQGVPEVPGAVQDISAALAYLAAGKQPLVVFAQSLGGALAVHAVSQSPYRERIKALVVDSAFSSYRVIAQEKAAAHWLTWPLQWPVAWVMDDDYSPLRVVDKLSPIPLLLVHTEHDAVVPIHHSQDLFARAQQPKEFWRIPEGGHIEAFVLPANRQRLTVYLDRYVGARRLG